jgi:hypothetical protein
MRHLPVLLLPTVGCIGYEGFLAKKYQKQCEVEATCNPELDCESDTGDVPADQCDFDAGAARDCLNGVWTCNDQFVGFEQAVPPQICEVVCKPAGPAQ